MPGHHDHPFVQPGRKPLYLMGATPLSIDAGDNHLLLRRPAVPIQRFPLARLARVICNRKVLWSGEALALCFQRDVAVTWLDGHGHAIGYAQGCHPAPEPTATLIEIFLDLDDWPDRLASWLIGRRLEILCACAQEAVRAGHVIAATHLQDIKRSFVHQGGHPVIVAPEWQGYCHALVVDHLQTHGLLATYRGFDAHPFELAACLGSLLWAELNLGYCGLVASVEQTHLLTHVFETWSRHHEHRLVHHLGALKCMLAREIDQWQ